MNNEARRASAAERQTRRRAQFRAEEREDIRNRDTERNLQRRARLRAKKEKIIRKKDSKRNLQTRFNMNDDQRAVYLEIYEAEFNIEGIKWLIIKKITFIIVL